MTGRVPQKVTLVVPMRNEEDSIVALLRSIERQVEPPDEVIFVDGGSTDRTVTVLRDAIGANSTFRVIEAGEATPGRGRNVGIGAAQHEWIALTDAGIHLEENWLKELKTALSDEHVAVVYGNYEPTADTFFERCAALLYAHPKLFRGTGWMRGPFIASSMMRRDVWARVGGFRDLRAAEDLIFMEKIEAEGFKQAWVPSATVWWRPQSTWLGTLRRFIAFSKANARAGRQRYWHYGIVRAYLVSAVFVLLAIVHSWYWLLIPVGILLLRVAKSIWQRRGNRGVLWALNPVQFLGVTLLLIAIDLGTIIGWIQWSLSSTPREVPSVEGQTTDKSA
jgi:glycosyltransferase involved in cell wall biosynthesis